MNYLLNDIKISGRNQLKLEVNESRKDRAILQHKIVTTGHVVVLTLFPLSLPGQA
jgi:hypothetical protein